MISVLEDWYWQVTSKELVSRGKEGGIKVRQYCEKQEKEIVEEEEVEESINKLTTFNLNTRKESEQEAKSALVKTPFSPYSQQHL